MTLSNLECKYLYTHSQLRTSSGKTVCLGWSIARQTLHSISELQDCVVLNVTQATIYHRMSKCYLWLSMHFHLVQLSSILFSSSLPYAYPLSNQTYILLILLIEFMVGTSQNLIREQKKNQTLADDRRQTPTLRKFLAIISVDVGLYPTLL